MKISIRNIINRLTGKKPKSYLLEDKYKVIPAFEWKGKTYYMHEDPLNVAAGRGLTALVFMEELLMRCSVDYLKMHTKAMEDIFSEKRIDLSKVILLNRNLKERINLLAALPENVYKMAAVVFFTEDESPFRYDNKAGEQKIKDWSEAPDMYAFFLQTPLKDLIPSLALPEQDSKQYLQVVEKINDLHLNDLREVLYKPV
jgi:hypothetical protein